jgi:hypothetical protein
VSRAGAVIVAIACIVVGAFVLLRPRTHGRPNTVPPLAYLDHWHAALGVYDCDH